jgi:hypothetical protein
MGWKSLYGTNVYMKDGVLAGNISDREAIIVSAPWLYTDLRECSKITLKIKNNSYATRLKISVFSRDHGPGFWKTFTEPVDWDTKEWITVPISSNDSGFVTYTIELSKFKEVNERLMQVALQPAFDTYNGSWEIDEIVVE